MTVLVGIGFERSILARLHECSLSRRTISRTLFHANYGAVLLQESFSLGDLGQLVIGTPLNHKSKIGDDIVEQRLDGLYSQSNQWVKHRQMATSQYVHSDSPRVPSTMGTRTSVCRHRPWTPENGLQK